MTTPNNPSLSEPPLSQPLYGARFGQAITRFFKKYGRFSGYASPSEYWWVQLAVFLYVLVTTFVLLFLADHFDIQSLNLSSFDTSIVISLPIIIPMISLSVRRLHDAGLHGAWFLLTFVPIFNSVAWIVFGVIPTRMDSRREAWDDHTGD